MPLSSLIRPSSPEQQSNQDRALSDPVLRFLRSVRESRTHVAKDEAVIHVSSAISGAAIFYERLRYSVDYREEHLLRRHALERILRRRFELSHTVEAVARPFLVELIHAQYLPNDTVPESAVGRVQAILDRYAAVLRAIERAPLRDKEALKDWCLGLASAELEDYLVPAPEEAALVELMTAVVDRDQPLAAWQLPPELERTLTFIAAYRALYAFDPPTLHHLLLRRNFPVWETSAAEAVPGLLGSLLDQHREMNIALRHPAGEKLWRTLKSRAIVFHSLSAIVKKHPDNAADVLSDEEAMTQEVGEVCNGYYRAARRRLYGSAMRSTFYILLTKVVIALVIEAPLEQAIYHQVQSLPLMINLAFPAALMITLTAATRLPGTANTKQVVLYLKTILYGSDRRVFPELSVARISRTMSGLSIVYVLTFVLTFGLILMGLLNIGFTIVSALLFLFFLSVVSFFALRVRQPVRDLFVVRPRDNMFTLLIDFFSLPILQVGRWISLTSSRFNVFLFLFDYFLEAPFKAFLLLTEDVLGFFREKREDIL